jgi:uncharacterized protein
MNEIKCIDSKSAIDLTKKFVKDMLSGEGSGHDWWHIYRVWNTAKYIAKKERGANIFTVELAALLHDIADRKFNNGDVEKGTEKVRHYLLSINVDIKIVEDVCEIVSTCSFASSFLENGQRRVMKTLEGKIVQDADRLDALGAIGIARTFAYGGHKGSEMYNPNVKPFLPTNKAQYTNGRSHSINHFYEKLLLLKDLMNTNTAKKLAEKRHKYMEEFLNQFYKEWAGSL